MVVVLVVVVVVVVAVVMPASWRSREGPKGKAVARNRAAATGT